MAGACASDICTLGKKYLSLVTDIIVIPDSRTFGTFSSCTTQRCSKSSHSHQTDRVTVTCDEQNGESGDDATKCYMGFAGRVLATPLVHAGRHTHFGSGNPTCLLLLLPRPRTKGPLHARSQGPRVIFCGLVGGCFWHKTFIHAHSARTTRGTKRGGRCP